MTFVIFAPHSGQGLESPYDLNSTLTAPHVHLYTQKSLPLHFSCDACILEQLENWFRCLWIKSLNSNETIISSQSFRNKENSEGDVNKSNKKCIKLSSLDQYQYVFLRIFICNPQNFES